MIQVTTWARTGCRWFKGLFAPNRLYRRPRSMHRRLPITGVKASPTCPLRPVTSVSGRTSAVGPTVMGDRGLPHRVCEAQHRRGISPPPQPASFLQTIAISRRARRHKPADRSAPEASNVRRLICKLALRPCRPGILGRVLDDRSLARNSRLAENEGLARHGQRRLGRLLWFGRRRLNDGWP